MSSCVGALLPSSVEQQKLSEVVSSQTNVSVRDSKGKEVSVRLEDLLLLLLLHEAQLMNQQSIDLAQEIDGLCAKIRLIHTLCDKIAEFSEKDGSLDWKHKGLEADVLAARHAGISVAMPERTLSRDEKEAVRRSLFQQRDDLSSKAEQLNTKLNHARVVHDDMFRYVLGAMSSIAEACKKIIRGIG